jgi:hypothetical protein
LPLQTHKSGLKSPEPQKLPSGNPARFERVLADILARLERLEALILPPDAAGVLAQLAASTAGRVFSTRELQAHGKIDPALAATLAYFRSPKALGRFLHEVASHPPPGAFVLERVLRERSGWLWKVSARENP